MCVNAAAAGLVSTQHGSGEDAEAGAPEADPQQQHGGVAATRLTGPTPAVVQRERPAAQPHREAATHQNPPAVSGLTGTFIRFVRVTSLKDGQGVPETTDHGGGLPWRLTLLPPGHQQLCHPGASGHQEEGEGGKGHRERRAQRPQTASYHGVQRARPHRGLRLSKKKQ